MKADFGVYIGRFQPFHNGHLATLRKALDLANEVIIVLGSSNEPRTIRNPFNDGERIAMIKASLTPEECARVHFAPVENSAYSNTTWAADVVRAVHAVAWKDWRAKRPVNITLIGHVKDDTGYYLRMFPQWEYVECGAYVDGGVELNATSIRDSLFRWTAYQYPVPRGVKEFLKEFAKTEHYTQLCAERAFIDRYRDAWKAAPYAPTFVTVDACVVQAGHVLLIERRAEPGKGLWALPGGFLEQTETIETAVLRELREETKLKVPEPVLRGSIVTSRVFDDPARSLRGRTITHAYLIHLAPHGEGLPEVKASSDARKARWWPLAQVKPSMMFEDHMSIIKSLTAAL